MEETAPPVATSVFKFLNLIPFEKAQPSISLRLRYSKCFRPSTLGSSASRHRQVSIGWILDMYAARG
jgi:hypothetical protein